MQRVPVRAHLGLYEDETSALCQWHIPEAHFLEAWSDVRSDDGTVTIIQPLIAPLYGGKSAHEVIAAIGGSGTLRVRARAGTLVPRNGPVDATAAGRPRRTDQRQGAAPTAQGTRAAVRTATRGAIAPTNPCRSHQRRRRRLRQLPPRRCRCCRRSTGSGADGCTTASCRTRHSRQEPWRCRPTSRLRLPEAPRKRRPDWKSSSVRTRASTTGASRTTRGCRSCRNRSRN